MLVNFTVVNFWGGFLTLLEKAPPVLDHLRTQDRERHFIEGNNLGYLGGGSQGAITDLHWLANVDSFGITKGFPKSKVLIVFRPFLKGVTEGSL